MDFSSSSSSSSSQYRGSAFPANSSSSSRPRWDLPIYDGAPHFPPMENRITTLNSQEISSSMQETARFASSSSPSYSNYPYNYSNYNYAGGGGASAAGSAGEMAEKREEGGDRPPGDSPAAPEEEREHMFDKVVTPSDVGKLNRLVIPKQHAEKYFPLDSSSSEKGLLLDFEDRNGKSWRFRYSYWNSSQSYVMTKGWSRFVKEKKLDAGDVVSFQRGLGETAKDHFYIDWRRRPDAPRPPPQIQFQHGSPLHHRSIHHPPFHLAGPHPPPPLPPPPLVLHHQARDHRQLMSVVAHPNHHRGSVISYNGLGPGATNSSGYSGDNNGNYNYYGVLTPNFCHQGSLVYMRGAPPPHHQMQMELAAATSRRTNPTASASGAAASREPMVLDSVPVVPGLKSTAAKRLRLFGVNMDCTVSDGRYSEVNPTAAMSHSSSSAEGSLQLRLQGSAASASDSMQTTTATTDFPDKGKSSMSLDFDL